METSSAEPAVEQLTVTRDAEGTVLMHGELDIASRPTLEDVLAHIPLDESVHIDMRAVTFIDSSGLGLLIKSYLDRNGGVRILHPSSAVERALRLTFQYERFVARD